MHITTGYMLDMFSDLLISLNVVWYLVYNEYCTWYTTSDDKQIITVFHLILQVYCSPCLKEYLHNPVMSILTCNVERRGSILHAHGGVCACVGVWWLCVNIHFVCISTSAFRMVDTSLQVYIHISNHTSTIHNTHHLTSYHITVVAYGTNYQPIPTFQTVEYGKI